MKRFLQITSSSNDSNVKKKTVNGDRSTIIDSDGSDDHLTLNLKSSSKLGGAVDSRGMLLTEVTERAEEYVSLLSEDDLKFADCSLLDRWMANDKIMYRFHSANQPAISQGSSVEEVSTANIDNHNGYDVIAFDMDSTIIKTKSGKSFPTNDDDWTLLHSSIKDTIQSLHRQQKYLTIISNQGSIKQQQVLRKGLQRKVDRIVEHLGIVLHCTYSRSSILTFESFLLHHVCH